MVLFLTYIWEALIFNVGKEIDCIDEVVVHIFVLLRHIRGGIQNFLGWCHHLFSSGSAKHW